jgi:putative nucleotidyltransferase with HDIG domain
MAKDLDLGNRKVDEIEMAALLHDIGKIDSVYEAVIRKPYDLNAEERTLIKTHATKGADLLQSLSSVSAEVIRAVRHHHERYDGSGYPDGLRGDEIPRLGRLLSVAVAFAEGTGSDAETLDLIRHRSATAFDPDAVRLLVRCLPRAAVPRRERELLMTELEPGMVVARGIYTANGILLIPEGQALSAAAIDKLKNHHRISPISQSLLVYC